MPVKYVFIDKQNDAIYFQREDGLFADSQGNVANETLLQNLACADNPMFAMLNAYRILQDTYEYTTGDIFASTAANPGAYCLRDGEYNSSDRCLTAQDVGNDEWFEQVDYIEDYL